MDVTNIGCHWHDALEIIWVVSGEVAMKESNLLCHLKQGDVYVVNYNETHKISTDNGPATLACVHIDYRYFTKYIPNLKEISYSHYFFSKNLNLEDALDNCRGFIKELWRLVRAGGFDEGMNKKIESAAHSFLLLVIDTFQYVYYEKHNDTYRDFIDKSNNLSHEQLQRLHRLTHYIYTHCHDKLTLDDVGQAVRRSKAIMQVNKENDYVLHQYKSYHYYIENPSLSIWVIIEKILCDCRLL